MKIKLLIILSKRAKERQIVHQALYDHKDKIFVENCRLVSADLEALVKIKKRTNKDGNKALLIDSTLLKDITEEKK